MRRSRPQRGRPMRRVVTAQQRDLDRRWWRAAAIRGGCVMCREFPVPRDLRSARFDDLRIIDGHHVLAKRHLRTNGHAARLWDQRNGLALCRYHHARHEAGHQRVPYELVPKGAIDFAAELGLDWILEREYPRERD